MKILSTSLAALGGALLLSASPLVGAVAQTIIVPVPTPAPAPTVVLVPTPAPEAAPVVETAPAAAPAHGDWTLRQREDWLSGRLEKSSADGSLDKASFNRARLEMDDLRKEESRMRHDANGQLTGNQTSELETRLDTMAAKIHWANMTDNARPW